MQNVVTVLYPLGHRSATESFADVVIVIVIQSRSEAKAAGLSFDK